MRIFIIFKEYANIMLRIPQQRRLIPALLMFRCQNTRNFINNCSKQKGYLALILWTWL